MQNKKNLWILVLIMIINALGFGIIVPLIYPFTKQFGINAHTLGLLISSFSIAQFIATPILGSLSDKYGRKPILIICLIGTTISFILFAEARSALMLFAARILDGLTGGNISVAQAVISDSTTPQERTKAFGYLGASFGVGFILGPLLGGVLSEISLSAPFLFSAALAALGAILTYFFLEETNIHKGINLNAQKVLDYKKPFKSLRKPIIGTAILIGFLMAVAQFSMIIGFQTFNVDVLKLSPLKIGLFFTSFGVVGIIMQLIGLPIFLKYIKIKPLILVISLCVTSVTLFLAGFTNSFIPFAVCLLLYGLFNALRDPMLNSIISENTQPEEQGHILGVNQSYLSIGQIIGPLIAGYISFYSINYIFIAAAVFILIALPFSIQLFKRHKKTSLIDE
ncbi:MFS transporter [Daejeonella oryzae]|uniref:MFS transporter n=1 Tax=Daejeonella oryzae TaxID=1122943 RepID=UPI00041AE792|nr:MFS transporter [Daejeonella oryzae]